MNDQPKTIKLTQGYEAIVDAEDYKELNKDRWHYNCGYAKRNVKINGKGEKILMHRVVDDTPNGMQTDHINHDTLDNRKVNLRSVTHQQNLMNQLPQKNLSSKHKGVYWYRAYRKWKAQIQAEGKRVGLGYFINEEDAAKAYNEAATKLFGVYARLNNV